MKKCSKCGQTKEIYEFGKDSRFQDRLRVWCKECHREFTRQWIMAHLQKKRESSKQWNSKHREKISETSKKWKAEHPEAVREHRRKERIKQKSTTKGKINRRMAVSIWKSLKSGAKAGRHWEDLVAYNVDELKSHLEKRFKPGMTWENYGTSWHIDHKVPISAFHFEKPDDIDFQLCWSLRNLQPLEARENLIKSDNLTCPFQPSLAINGGIING